MKKTFLAVAAVVATALAGLALAAPPARPVPTHSLPAVAAVIDFASTSVGVVESDAITVTGAMPGDDCTVAVPTAAGALAAKFECYVSAANTAKVKFTPLSMSAGTTAALNGASPSVITATVLAGSVCQATLNGAAAAAFGPAVGVSSTTLTITGANGATNTVNYLCYAPVNPASGAYFVRVMKKNP